MERIVQDLRKNNGIGKALLTEQMNDCISDEQSEVSKVIQIFFDKVFGAR
ncbi:MAG: hypothetical protein HFI57_04790 [Lachnospiraceae bacterium]|nr:hypothetical protein [Lachnospiraceae bacterium]